MNENLEPAADAARAVGGVRILMRDGKWLVPRAQRPPVAPPPREVPEIERRVRATIPDAWGHGEGLRPAIRSTEGFCMSPESRARGGRIGFTKWKREAKRNER